MGAPVSNARSLVALAALLVVVGSARADIPALVLSPNGGVRLPFQVVQLGVSANFHLKHIVNVTADYSFRGLNQARGNYRYFELLAGYPLFNWAGTTRHQEALSTDVSGLGTSRQTTTISYQDVRLTARRAIVVEGGLMSANRFYRVTEAGQSFSDVPLESHFSTSWALGLRYLSAWHAPKRNMNKVWAHVLLPYKGPPEAPEGGFVSRDDRDEQPETRSVGWRVGMSITAWANSLVNLEAEIGQVPADGNWLFVFGLSVPLWPLNWGDPSPRARQVQAALEAAQRNAEKNAEKNRAEADERRRHKERLRAARAKRDRLPTAISDERHRANVERATKEATIRPGEGGFGIHLGMSEARIAEQLGAPLEVDQAAATSTEPRRKGLLYDDLYVTLTDDRATWIEFSSGLTPEGVTVGTTAAQAHAVLGEPELVVAYGLEHRYFRRGLALLVVKGVVKRIFVDAPAEPPSGLDLAIEPGVGVGPVRLGAPCADALAALGGPARSSATGPSTNRVKVHYFGYERELEVRCDKTGKVFTILLQPPFRGKTAGGLGLHNTLDELTAGLGGLDEGTALLPPMRPTRTGLRAVFSEKRLTQIQVVPKE
jgi:hypothetical protein